MFVLNARWYACTCKHYCCLAEKLLCHKTLYKLFEINVRSDLLNISEWQNRRLHAHTNLILLHASRSYCETFVKLLYICVHAFTRVC